MKTDTLKATLRSQMLEQRSAFKREERILFEKRACDHLIQLIKERKIQVFHTYLPMGLEPNIYPVISFALEQKITVVTTRTLKRPTLQHLVLHSLNDLAPGVFGTKYPRDSEEWLGEYDLIIVPGLAFDQNGNRLGYGGGYYDHFLKQHPSAYKVSLAFPFQLRKDIPIESHDQKVDLIIV